MEKWKAEAEVARVSLQAAFLEEKKFQISQIMPK
jgi:hypothetical protein